MILQVVMLGHNFWSFFYDQTARVGTEPQNGGEKERNISPQNAKHIRFRNYNLTRKFSSIMDFIIHYTSLQ